MSPMDLAELDPNYRLILLRELLAEIRQDMEQEPNNQDGEKGPGEC